MMVHIHRGKGAKDRYIPLPQSRLVMLRAFWLTHQHRTFIFPADGRDHRGVSHRKGPSQATTTMSPTAVQGAIKLITKHIHFGKKISTHTFRHSFATRLLEAGVARCRRSLWPITSQISWTVDDEQERTLGERLGVSPPCLFRCPINDHFQNTPWGVLDPRAR
jgi:integrase